MTTLTVGGNLRYAPEVKERALATDANLLPYARPEIRNKERHRPDRVIITKRWSTVLEGKVGAVEVLRDDGSGHLSDHYCITITIEVPLNS